MAKILLEKGVDVNTQGIEYGNAVQIASAEGYEQIEGYGSALERHMFG